MDLTNFKLSKEAFDKAVKTLREGINEAWVGPPIKKVSYKIEEDE